VHSNTAAFPSSVLDLRIICRRSPDIDRARSERAIGAIDRSQPVTTGIQIQNASFAMVKPRRACRRMGLQAFEHEAIGWNRVVAFSGVARFDQARKRCPT
jgi:hypothetical protein